MPQLFQLRGPSLLQKTIGKKHSKSFGHDFIEKKQNLGTCPKIQSLPILALDVTIVNPLTPARLTSLASNPGQTLITAFNNKCRHTLEACSDEGIVFVPVCQESLGGYHERSASVLKRIALAQSRAKGNDETETIKNFFKKLSIILQKENCSLLILHASF